MDISHQKVLLSSQESNLETLLGLKSYQTRKGLEYNVLTEQHGILYCTQNLLIIYTQCARPIPEYCNVSTADNFHLKSFIDDL